ncbi:MAG: CPBP family intramembrane glutamic endopeptidase [Cyclobacteriaceae bacterium]
MKPLASTNNPYFLKPIWQSVFRQRWAFGIALILLWGAIRFWMVLQANVSGSYQWVSLIFVSMWIAPFLFLTRNGRRQIGMTWPRQWSWLLLGLILGGLVALLMYWIGTALYGHTDQHWFGYISHTYSVPVDLSTSDRWLYFGIFSSVGMTFSPIGEELFYRGMVHESFVPRWGDRIASYLDSAAFALVHLAHFGIVYRSGQWEWWALPGLLWVLLLFGLCQLFFLVRKRSGSILGAILCHAGYNAAMTYTIFFYLL